MEIEVFATGCLGDGSSSSSLELRLIKILYKNKNQRYIANIFNIYLEDDFLTM